MDDLAVAFAMRCDQQGLSYEAGVRLAEQIMDDLEAAAETRKPFAPREDAE